VKEKIFASLILLFLLLVYYNSVVIRGNSFMTTMERSYRLGQYHYSGTYWHVARKFATIDPAASNQINLPSAYLEHHYLKKFQLPLWNPYSGLGRPYNADMNSYTFFLPIYFFKLFPSLMMYDLFLLLRLFISGFFLFLLLRLFRCSFWVATAGASVYMFNSYFHAFVDMDQLNVTMFLSPMAYFLTKFLFSSNKRYLLGFIFFSAGSFYGGNPNEFVLVHLFVTIYFIFLVVIKKDLEFRKKIGFFFSYLAGLGMSGLLSSLKLVPFLEFWRNSLSSRLGGLTGVTETLSLKKFLIWMLYPNKMFQGPNYLGYLVLSLVFYAFFNLVRKRWRLGDKIVAFHFILLFLLISKINGAFYVNWIGTLPLLNNINYIKYSSLIYYMISVISAFSLLYLLEDIKKTRTRNIRLCLFLFCCVLPLFIFQRISGKFLFQAADNGQILFYAFLFFIASGFFLIIIRAKYSRRVITNGAVIVLMLLVVFELRLNSHQYYRKRFKIDDKAPYTRFLMEQEQPFRVIGIGGTLMPDCNLVYPIPAINSMFAIREKRQTILLSKLISDKFNRGSSQIYAKEEIWQNPFLDLLNTKYFISESVEEAIVIDPDYAKAHEVKALINNPAMQYTHRGNLYTYTHWGWQQLADSSVEVPVCLPYGDIFLKSTALAFDFERRSDKNPENKLILTISIKQGGRRKVVFRSEYGEGNERDRDFFNLKVNLSKYAGEDVVLVFALRNPRARSKDDRAFFFGDLRITYNKIKKETSEHSSPGKSIDSADFEAAPYEEVFFHHAVVYLNNKAMERGFMLYRMKQVRDLNEAITIMGRDPLLYKNTALIEGNLPECPEIGKKGQSRITFIDYKANSIKTEIETSENGIFVLSDAYYPGWEAYLNGKKVKIYPAFGALRAVLIPKGKHELKFLYRPWTFYLGGVLTFLSFLFLLTAFFKIKVS
jgi:hypothetical protein